MRTSYLRAGELDLFVEAGGAPEHRREVKSYVEDMFATGSMHPEWCFVLEEGDRALGRAALWTLPNNEKPLDAPPMWPQFQRFHEERVELLDRAGFALTRETLRFEWRDGPPPDTSGRLVFRALEEVGEEVGEGAFVDAVARVSEGALDRDMSGEREKQGPREAAREFFEEEQDMEYEPGWWELAYTPDGGAGGTGDARQEPDLAGHRLHRGRAGA